MPARSTQRYGLTAHSAATAMLLLVCLPAHAQTAGGKRTGVLPQDSRRSISRSDSGVVWLFTCKYPVVIMPGCDDETEVPSERIPLPAAPEAEPLLKVHGNVLYNYTYRSYIDTPFAEHNISQHLVQTNLNFLYRNKYPFRVTISSRTSNSQWFQNAVDVNVQFSRSQLLGNIKDNLKARAAAIAGTGIAGELENLYRQRLQQLEETRNWLNSPARIQEMIEAKEAQLTAAARSRGEAVITDLTEGVAVQDVQNVLNAPGSMGKNLWGGLKDKAIDAARKKAESLLPADSSLLKKYEEKKRKLEKLEREVKEIYGKAAAARKAVQDSVAAVKAAINSLKTGPGLYRFMKKHGISRDSLSRAQKLLLSVTQAGIGRAWADYSELTVKNISLAGVNIEMNPLPFYFAFAAGRVNYRFRDFLVKNGRDLPAQSLYLVRAGIGEKERNNLIFTFYSGKKNVLSSTASPAPAPLQPVLGFSAEARLMLNENNSMVAEVAKSSYQNAGVPLRTGELLTKATNMRIRTNEAYSIKLFSFFPQTNTKLTAWYRSLGEHFQSFNLLPVNAGQEAFAVRLNQPFWKKRILLDASVRKNDFESPAAAPGFSSTAIFKSLQLTVRIPKYPFVTVGYYPSSQLSLSQGNVLVENQYNTLNAVVSHNYRVKTLAMNTNAVFTRFYNSSADTGFIYQNAVSWSVNHSFFMGPLLLQTGFTAVDQQDLKMTTLEQLAGLWAVWT